MNFQFSKTLLAGLFLLSVYFKVTKHTEEMKQTLEFLLLWGLVDVILFVYKASGLEQKTAIWLNQTTRKIKTDRLYNEAIKKAKQDKF